MEMQNEYINLVVLGSFNPAILTHDFLIQECGLDIAGEPSAQIPNMPVVATVEYDSLSFFADLGRLQITEKNCSDPKSSRIPSYLKTYLEKLPHTPLTKCGANFSYSLSVDTSKLESLAHWLKEDRQKFCETLQLEEVDLDVSFVVNKGTEAIKSWVVGTKVREYDAYTKMRVATLSRSDANTTIDFNYEITGLDADKDLLRGVTVDYPKVVDEFMNQIEMILPE